MRDVNKIIEMALDFNVHDVENPFSPEFHQALAGQRVVVYYGATSDKFWDIIKNGINVKPTLKHTRISHTERGDEEEIDLRPNELHFSTMPASDAAKHAAYMANHENSDGPIQPMIIVAEVNFEKPHQAAKGEMGELIGQAMGAEANTVLPLHVKPNQIVGVVYPAATDKYDTPIKKFLRMVRSGEVDGIEPDPTFRTSKYRPYGPTTEAWQHVVVRYVNDLLNYSSNLYDYLLGRNTDKLNDVVIREATKIGLSPMMHWTGEQFVKWIYSILPKDPDWDTSEEDDIQQIMSNGAHEGWNRPFYQLFKKYSDESDYLIRSGKKNPTSLLTSRV
jgi:hypothetical protein